MEIFRFIVVVLVFIVIIVGCGAAAHLRIQLQQQRMRISRSLDGEVRKMIKEQTGYDPRDDLSSRNQ